MDKERQLSTTAYPILIYMVDSADHVTPKTGLTLTVTLSKNGAAFGAAAGAVTELSGGFYKLAGNATDRNTLGSLAVKATAAGADPFQAVFNIVAHDPFQALSDVQGSGFATATDSLAALRDKWDADFSPVVVAAVDGATNELTALDRMINSIRREADEPSVDPKYTDAALIAMIEESYQVALADLGTADNPLKVRHHLQVDGAAAEYLLPPNVGQIVMVGEVWEDTLLPRTQWLPRPVTNWLGPGFTIEGRILRVLPERPTASTVINIVMEYIPNGDFKMHYGTGTAVLATPTTFVLAATPTRGALDTRENAYVGAILRTGVDGTGYVQERTITAYDRTTRTATVNLAFSPALDGSVVYEVVPLYYKLTELQVVQHVAERILASSGKVAKHAMVEKQHAKTKRAIIIHLNRIESIVGDHFDQRTAWEER